MLTDLYAEIGAENDLLGAEKILECRKWQTWCMQKLPWMSI